MAKRRTMLEKMKQTTSYGTRAGVVDIPENLPPMFDANTGAALTGMSAKFIRDRCQDGTIKAVKCGRSWRINRDAFLEQFGLIA